MVHAQPLYPVCTYIIVQRYPDFAQSMLKKEMAQGLFTTDTSRNGQLLRRDLKGVSTVQGSSFGES